MDKEAVWSASENELHKLGLTERGHIICLKKFCMPSAATTDTDIKKELAAAVKQASKHRVVAKKKEIVSHIIEHKGNNQTREENCQPWVVEL